MAIEVLTKDDLNQFKTELFAEISQLLSATPQNKQELAQIQRSFRAANHLSRNVAKSQN